MTRKRVNIKRVLREKNARDENSRISRIREIQILDTQGKLQAFSFNIETINDLDNEDPQYDALAWHLDDMWHEACWSYVWGMFRATIVMATGAVEAGLKYRLREVGQLEDEENATFGTCINKSQHCGVLPRLRTTRVIKASWDLNKLRNDIIHANEARRNPEGALSCEGHEHEIIEVGQGLSLVHEFKLGAKKALKDSRAVLVYLRRYKARPSH
jgi:hypothetical protein